MAIYKVKYGQTIFDIAVERYGDISAVSQILIDNPTINFDTILVAGSDIVVSPNASNVTNQQNYSYFKNRTITNSESIVESINTSAYTGTIETNRSNSSSFINNSIWGSASELRFYNDSIGTYDRVSMNKNISFNGEGDFLDFDFTYDNSVVDQVVIGSDTGASIRISGSTLNFYSDGGALLISSKFTVPSGANNNVVIKSTLNISGNSIKKGLDISVNGYVNTVFDLESNTMNLNVLASSEGAVGLNGTIGKLNINGDIFRFLEGSGKYVYKTV